MSSTVTLAADQKVGFRKLYLIKRRRKAPKVRHTNHPPSCPLFGLDWLLLLRSPSSWVWISNDKQTARRSADGRNATYFFPPHRHYIWLSPHLASTPNHILTAVFCTVCWTTVRVVWRRVFNLLVHTPSSHDPVNSWIKVSAASWKRWDAASCVLANSLS